SDPSRVPDATTIAHPTNPPEGHAMSMRIASGLSLLATLTLVNPAGAADKLSMQAFSARLAATPTGKDAESLADDVRAWFGKDRAGRNNVITGANPRVEGLETAWAIEAPAAKGAAVVASDGMTRALTRIGDTPIFAARYPLIHGSAFRWSYWIDGTQVG